MSTIPPPKQGVSPRRRAAYPRAVFRTVLIANRGEIACRIAASVRDMGLRPVTVHSSADADAPHVRACDAAIDIGGPMAAESYLDVTKILDAAKQLDADALHPGYGFLSENAAFARACEDVGVTFIGPPPEVIEAMGDKAEARRRMIDAGVPVVPGSDDPADAASIGFPLLVKAAGGGGGIGMKVVKKPEKLAKALASASDRAAASFANPDVYMERLVDPCHHVEVQVLGDTAGREVHLGERERSIQRRRQKVLEESPSPLVERLGPALRHHLTTAAVRAAESVGYVGAGTVEFIVDPTDGSFYFIEMNTRLQVEHPITEERYDMDLVQAQVRIADGEPLAAGHPGPPQGHAIELRLYAENPAKKFLPSPGTLTRLDLPPWPSLRLDMGYAPGQQVTPYYDPLLGKIIAHADERSLAIERLVTALEHSTIEGIRTNAELLSAILVHPDFIAGATPTRWLEATLPDLLTTSSRGGCL